MHGKVIGSSDPKSCVEEIEAKTGARAEKAEAEAEDIEAEAGAEEEDTTEDGKTAGETATEEICRAAERQCLRREYRQADLEIGDKESRKRHSSDGNTSKRLKTGSGARENDKDDTLPDDQGKEEVETWFEVRG